MSTLAIYPIVEGRGEVDAVPCLLNRLVPHLGGTSLRIPKRPYQLDRGQMLQRSCVEKALNHGAYWLQSFPAESVRPLILVMFDSDEDLPCELAPRMLDLARQLRSDLDISCVIAQREYETWFIAAATSLQQELNAAAEELTTELMRDLSKGKGWIEQRFRTRTRKYAETVDQLKFTRMMDLDL